MVPQTVPETVVYNDVVPPEYAGWRLDQALAEMFQQFSRNRLKQWIEAGLVEVDDRVLRPKDKVVGGEMVRIKAVTEPEVRVEPEDIPLSILHEDSTVLVIDKPAGLVVHPGAGNPGGTYGTTPVSALRSPDRPSCDARTLSRARVEIWA